MREIICTDSLEYLKEVKNKFDLIVTSPPYNIGKEYEKKTSLDNYKKWLKPFIERFYLSLTSEGQICFQVGNFVDKGKVYPLDCVLFQMFIDAGFIPRGRIVWTFGNGLHCKKRFSGRHETIMWFSKSENY